MKRTMVKYTTVVSVGLGCTIRVVILQCPVPSVILQCFMSARSPLSAPALCAAAPLGEGRPVSYLKTASPLLPARLVTVSGWRFCSSRSRPSYWTRKRSHLGGPLHACGSRSCGRGGWRLELDADDDAVAPVGLDHSAQTTRSSSAHTAPNTSFKTPTPMLQAQP